MSRDVSLKIEAPGGTVEILVPPGDAIRPLSDTLRQHGLPLNTRCGGRDLCHGCTVDLESGTLCRRSTGEIVSSNGQPTTVRACQYALNGTPNTHIRVPARSLLGHEPQVVMNFRLNVPRAHDPVWQVIAVPVQELASPTNHEDALLALSQFVAHRLGTTRLVQIEANWNDEFSRSDTLFAVTEYSGTHWTIAGLNTTQPRPHLGVAIDIGTTTVALLLVDLDSGKVVGQSGAFNRQMHLGDDVLTRINLCMTNPSQIPVLQEAVVQGTIVPLLNETLAAAGAQAEEVACFVAAGNSTMQHLLAGVDPTSMGIAPFTPTFLDHQVLSSRTLGITSSEDTTSATTSIAMPDGIVPKVHLLPGAAAYVGADLCAGILSSGLIYDEGPSLLVDVGTNGEIIFKHGDQMFGCATAAGPAFEGAGLTSGMRAGDGAISHVAFDDATFQIQTEHINPDKQRRPLGICGSAYVDFLAEAHQAGLLTISGRFDRTGTAGEAMLRQERILQKEYGWQLQIARAPGGQPIVITEPDIASLLQAKAAIAAGILTLLERCDTRPEDVKTVYLAGGFGLHLNIANAIGCGLLPGFSPSQIQVVGNTSLAGAYLALLDSHTIDEMENLRQQMEIIELNLDPGFESRYIDQLMLDI